MFYESFKGKPNQGNITIKKNNNNLAVLRNDTQNTSTVMYFLDIIMLQVFSFNSSK